MQAVTWSRRRAEREGTTWIVHTESDRDDAYSFERQADAAGLSQSTRNFTTKSQRQKKEILEMIQGSLHPKPDQLGFRNDSDCFVPEI